MNMSDLLRKKKPKILITFQEGGQNGGPYISHERIMLSSLKDYYEFVPLFIKKPKEQLKIKNFFKLVLKIRKEKPDIFHFTGLQLIGFVSLLAAIFSGCKKSICAVRGSSLEALNFPKWKQYIMKIIENWTIKHSSLCYGVSKYVANWDRLNKYNNCFGFIYNLHDYNDHKDINENIRKKFNIPNEDLIIISTGRITEEKGYDILTKIIVTGNFEKKIHFMIVGSGDYLSQMKYIIDNSKINCKVHFTGYQQNVTKYLQASDIFILCTKHETLGNSIIEACNNRLPVVVSDIGGIPEIISHEENGFLTRVGDINNFIKYLQLLINDKQLRLNMGSKGKIIIQEKFNKNNIINKLNSIYELVLSNKK